MSGFANSVLGGMSKLIRSAIQSPNYVHNSAGWTINKDGSAEFNNLEVRGTFNGTDYILNSSGAFFYSSTPASGNLIASIASTSGTDAFGNNYPAGIRSQENTFGTATTLFGSGLSFNTVFGLLMFLSTNGLFLYSGPAALGNLIVSLASAAGTDSFGNAYPQGLNVKTGAISGTTFNGTNFVINSSGMFFYSGTPALGNLVCSIAPAAGTDSLGNAFVQGFGSYGSPDTLQTQFGVRASISNYAGLFWKNAANPPSDFPLIVCIGADSNGCDLEFYSGLSTGLSQASSISLEDSKISGVTNGFIDMICGQFQVGASGAFQWNDNTEQLNLPAAGGPFISGEGFHTVSLAAGLTGQLSGGVGIRVKKLPWNAIWLDIEVSASAIGTFNCGSLPDATYYPNAARHFAIPSNATVAQNIRVFVPTSGGLQIIASANTGAWAGGCSVMYPTN